jgi:diguanylate cyclase (GGDEF)-like protein
VNRAGTRKAPGRLVAWAGDADRRAAVEALVDGLAGLPDAEATRWTLHWCETPDSLARASLDADAVLVAAADPEAALAALPTPTGAPVVALVDDGGAGARRALALGADEYLPAREATPLLLQRTLRVTERARSLQGRIEHLAQHDVLTGLPNRRLFERQLQHAIHGAARHGRALAVGCLTLDGFRRVVADHGQGGAEALLVAVAGRLSDALRRSDLVARDRDDAFLLLLEGGGDVADLAATAEKLRGLIAGTVRLESGTARVTASLGLAVFPHAGTAAGVLLGEARAARDAVAAGGGDDFRFYDAGLEVVTRQRLELEAALPGAIARGELRRYYQPRLDLATLRVTGAEVLLRWESPVHGWVDPSRFIPIAEASGAIGRIGTWVLRGAVADARRWADAGHRVRLGVNVSAGQLAAEDDFVGEVRAALDGSGLDAELLELELTERVFVGHGGEAATQLEALADLGVGLAVDDFGIGYSSLAYLKHFPVHALKIDRSFVDPVPGAPQDEAIVRAIVALARALDLRVVAEGVERREQLAFLRDAGCDEVQGFLVRPGVPEAEFVELLDREEPFEP